GRRRQDSASNPKKFLRIDSGRIERDSVVVGGTCASLRDDRAGVAWRACRMHENSLFQGIFCMLEKSAMKTRIARNSSRRLTRSVAASRGASIVLSARVNASLTREMFFFIAL